jgi:hypothetical protein
MIVGRYKVSSTRGKQPALHLCKVVRGVEVVALVYPFILDPEERGHSDPYRFVRAWPETQTRKSFVEQLSRNGVSPEDIRMILDGVTEPQEKIKKPRKNKQEN